MEVKIGVRSVHREIVLETDMTIEEIETELRNALAVDRGVFTLTDVKGNRVIIPVASLGFVELGEGETRSIGFGGTM